jgi:hypothetical protein
MAFFTCRWPVEPLIGVTVTAIDVRVVIIKLLTGNRVIEGIGFPVRVTSIARSIQFGKRNSLVAVTAVVVLMMPAKRPTCLGMVKGRRSGLSFVPVTVAALAAFQHIRLVA